MAVVCGWHVESGKLMHPSMSGYSSSLCLHELQAKWVFVFQVAEEVLRACVSGGEMSDKNLDKCRVCVKTGKSASEALVLLTLAYAEYAMKKYVFIGRGGK
jgi:hypothetical protein